MNNELKEAPTRRKRNVSFVESDIDILYKEKNDKKIKDKENINDIVYNKSEEETEAIELTGTIELTESIFNEKYIEADTWSDDMEQSENDEEKIQLSLSQCRGEEIRDKLRKRQQHDISQDIELSSSRIVEKNPILQNTTINVKNIDDDDDNEQQQQEGEEEREEGEEEKNKSIIQKNELEKTIEYSQDMSFTQPLSNGINSEIITDYINTNNNTNSTTLGTSQISLPTESSVILDKINNSTLQQDTSFDYFDWELDWGDSHKENNISVEVTKINDNTIIDKKDSKGETLDDILYNLQNRYNVSCDSLIITNNSNINSTLSNRRDSEFGLAGTMHRQTQKLAGELLNNNNSKNNNNINILKTINNNSIIEQCKETNTLQRIQQSWIIDTVEIENVSTGYVQLLEMTDICKEKQRNIFIEKKKLLSLDIWGNNISIGKRGYVLQKLVQNSIQKSMSIWYNWRNELLLDVKNTIYKRVQELENEINTLNIQYKKLEFILQCEIRNRDENIVKPQRNAVLEYAQVLCTITQEEDILKETLNSTTTHIADIDTQILLLKKQQDQDTIKPLDISLNKINDTFYILLTMFYICKNITSLTIKTDIDITNKFKSNIIKLFLNKYNTITNINCNIICNIKSDKTATNATLLGTSQQQYNFQKNNTESTLQYITTTTTHSTIQQPIRTTCYGNYNIKVENDTSIVQKIINGWEFILQNSMKNLEYGTRYIVGNYCFFDIFIENVLYTSDILYELGSLCELWEIIPNIETNTILWDFFLKKNDSKIHCVQKIPFWYQIDGISLKYFQIYPNDKQKMLTMVLQENCSKPSVDILRNCFELLNE